MNTNAFFKTCLAAGVLLGATFAQAQHSDASPPKHRKKVGDVKTFKSLFGPGFANARSTQAELDISGKKVVGLNYTSGENGQQKVGGRLGNDKSSSFLLNINNDKIEGFSYSIKEKKAFKYHTNAAGEVEEEEIDIHKLLCIEYGQSTAPVSAPSAAVTANAAFAGWDTQQSNPSSSKVIYLDFDGESIPANSNWNGNLPFTQAPSGLSESDRVEVWKSVSEDFAPFDINVTTSRLLYDATPYTSRVMIVCSPKNSSSPGASGVAFMDSYGTNYSPVHGFSYGTTAKECAEICSHELGHTFNLGHDGKGYGNSNETYYGGHLDWAPIMGNSVTSPVIQWSKGEYANANNLEDDISIIGAHIGIKPDDAGASIATAKNLTVAFPSNTPDFAYINPFENKGLIATPQDVDVYKFTVPANTLLVSDLTIATVPNFYNLDIKARLTNSSGTNLVVSDDQTSMNAKLGPISLTAGTYYIFVEGVGKGNPLNTGYSDYGSIGTYEIYGTFNVSAVGGPSIYLTGIKEEQTTTKGTVFNLTAVTAVPSPGTIARVDFIVDYNVVFSDYTAPYQYNWTSTAGFHEIYANVYSNTQITSSLTHVVDVIDNTAPTCNLSFPTTNTRYTTPYQYFSFSAADAESQLQSASVYIDDRLITVPINSTFVPNIPLPPAYSTYTMYNGPGNHTMYMIIRDAQGATCKTQTVPFSINSAPGIAITSPTNSQIIAGGPVTVTINANATDDAGISKVEFYNGATLLNTDLTAPYSYAWPSVAKGVYTITAKATDSEGAVTTSAAVTFSVGTAPAVSITAPVANTVYATAPANIVINATATDADGTIARVEFYNGTTLLNTDNASPYSYTLTGIVLGNYNFTAKAFDNNGLSKTSSIVSVSVGTPPTVSFIEPTATTFDAPATVYFAVNATDASGIQKVEYYVNEWSTTSPWITATSAAYNYRIGIEYLPAGTYTITARAYDNQGVYSNATKTITVSNTNKGPNVSIISPYLNEIKAQNPVNFEYYAADRDGTVASVQLYIDGVLNATYTGADALSNKPFSATLTNGAHTTYLVVTDNLGKATTYPASPLTFKVCVRPTFTLAASVNPILTTGGSTTLTATGPTGTTYAWSPASYLNTTTGGTVIATPPAGQEYTVTYTNGVCSYTSKIKINVYNNPFSANALKFTNSNQVAMIPANSKMTFPTGSCTFEIVMRVDAYPAPQYPGSIESVINNTNASGSGYVELWINRSQPGQNDYLTFRTGRGTVGIGRDLKDGLCHHYALVTDANYTYMYIDGVLVNQQANYNYYPLGNTVSPWTLGNVNDTYQNYGSFSQVLHGALKEFRVWNTARTQTQIQSSMNSKMVGNESGLIGYWPMDAGTGQTILDKAANPVNGYLGNNSSNTNFDATWVTNTCQYSGGRTEKVENNAIAQQVEESLLYPNPFTQEVNLALQEDEIVDLEILDAMGTVLKTEKGVSAGYSFGTDLPSGCYFVKISDAYKQRIVKVVKH